MLKLSTDQKLWFVGAGNFHRVRGEVTVTEVGRKWARITGVYKGKIAVATLAADGAGYSSPGICYASKQDWLNQDGPRRAWQALRSSMPTACPHDLSYETIVQAAKLLGVDINLLAESAG
jgi:hypothetical protein